MLTANRDNLSQFSFEIYVKPSEHSHTLYFLPVNNCNTFLCLAKQENNFCLTKSNTLRLTYWLKYLNTSLHESLTKLSNEELQIWKHSVSINLLLMSKLVYLSNPFGVAYILKLNLRSSCIIRCES